ncbi:hypothetical protein GCM10025873_13570 [Demequina sediminis]|uniref:hypothetical protein n=1 Tax=Demequina sediminis TaxID=1930058 RepID=UPI0025727590|nr:hypothetical protein [Demequina sediminis]BDZ61566.1 hypothetical protein GCM10025873_13570 [Demequina sediminis]
MLYVALTRARDRLAVTRTVAHTPVRAWVGTGASAGFVEDAYFLGTLPELLVRETVHVPGRAPRPAPPPGLAVPAEVDLSVDLGEL